MQGAAATIEDLEVALQPARGEALRVVIDDGSSPPLDGLAFVALLPRPALLFALPVRDGEQGAGVATLRFGGGRAFRPRYDVASLPPSLPAMGESAQIAETLHDVAASPRGDSRRDRGQPRLRSQAGARMGAARRCGDRSAPLEPPPRRRGATFSRGAVAAPARRRRSRRRASRSRRSAHPRRREPPVGVPARARRGTRDPRARGRRPAVARRRVGVDAHAADGAGHRRSARDRGRGAVLRPLVRAACPERRRRGARDRDRAAGARGRRSAPGAGAVRRHAFRCVSSCAWSMATTRRSI